MSYLARLPPTTIRGPRRIPLLGPDGGLLRFFSDPVAQLFSLHKQYGRVAAVSDRDPALVCAFAPEHNRTILSDARRFENHAEVPIKMPPDSAPLRLNTALTSMNGDTHRRQRRMMMPAFSRESVEGHRDAMAAVADERLARLRPGDSIDFAAEAIELSLRLAMRCLFGIEVGDDADSLGRLGLRYLQGMTSPAAMFLPFRFPGSPYARFLDTSDKLERAIRALIAERRHRGAGGRDVLSILIGAHDDDGSAFSDAELVGQSAVLFIASHETTAQTLTWTLFLLSQHPAVMNALDEELRVLGGAAPSVADLGRLPLLDRVVKESMRLIPATPFLFMRRATEPFQLDEHALPAGSVVILSSLVTHRLPELYERPDSFAPERWEKIAPTTYEYLPFGAGPRTCIGGTFAAQAIRVVLASLLQRFHVELQPGVSLHRKVQGITLGTRSGLPLRLVERGAARAVRPVGGDYADLVDLRAN